MNLKPIYYKEKEEKFMKYWAKNTDDTKYCGFECLKSQYSFMLGNCTDLTGFPGSGKTELALEFQMYLSEEYGYRHALYVPDIGNYNEVRRKIMHKFTGKTFSSKYPHYIQEVDILNANDWVDNHFIILGKVDSKKGVPPQDFWEFVCTYKDAVGIIHTGLLDSWKNMTHDLQNGREDLYLDSVLSLRNEMAEENNRHFFTIAHASKTEYNSGEKKRRIPDANDIKGGTSWFSNGRVIMTVDYPDKETNATDVYFSKVKPDTIGKIDKPVIDLLRFDWARSRFYELEPNYMNHKFYAGELAKRGEIPALNFVSEPEIHNNPDW